MQRIYYLYGVDGVAGFNYNGETYLYRKNVQGDVTHIYKQEDNLPLQLVAEYVYDAWGNYQILTDIDGIAALNPFRYRSYYYDVETGLYYLQTRYYDSETGRFISSDSIEYLDPETLGGLNLYAYCGNNPVMFTDPEGTTKWWEWALIVVAAVAVAALTIVTCGAVVGITAVAVGAAVGAAYGAVQAVATEQDVVEGAIMGLFTGVIMAGTAAMGTTVIAGAVQGGFLLAASGDLMVGLAISAAGGMAVGAFTEVSNQYNQYGAVVDHNAVKAAAITYGAINIFSTLLGVPTAKEVGVAVALVGSYLYDVIAGCIGLAIEALKYNIFKNRKKKYRIPML